MGLSDWTAATSTAAGWWVGGLFASARGTGCLQFGECSPREFAEVVAAGGVAPVLVGDLPGERAQFRGQARGQAGNAAPAELAGQRRGETEALQRLAFLQFGAGGDHRPPAGDEFAASGREGLPAGR